MKRGVAVLTMALVACGPASADSGAGGIQKNGAASAQVTDVASSEAELGAPAVTLSAMMETGICNDLAQVLGRPVPPGMWPEAELPGVIRCDSSFGVELVTVSSLFITAGVGQTPPANPPTALVNGKTVGVMDVTLRGPQAMSLFQGMSTTWSVSPHDTERQSPSGPIRCRVAPGNAHVLDSPLLATCTLRGLVGFSLSP